MTDNFHNLIEILFYLNLISIIMKITVTSYIFLLLLDIFARIHELKCARELASLILI